MTDRPAIMRHLVLMAGEANMAGFKTDDASLRDAFRGSGQSQIWAETGWAPLKAGAGYQPSGFGPELGFANTWEHESALPLSVVKVARANTRLAQHWFPDGTPGRLLLRLIAQARVALSTGLVQLGGLIWLQGETDAADEARAAEYGTVFPAMVDYLRSALRTPGLPVIIGHLPKDGSARPHGDLIRAGSETLSGPSTVFDYGDLPLRRDGVHVMPRGLFGLGERAAQSLIALDAPAPAPEAQLWTQEDVALTHAERINRRHARLGFFAKNLAPLPHCTITTPDWTTRAGDGHAPGNGFPRNFGSHLFAGVADKQFGFCLLNSLGRLWALDQMPKDTTLVYLAKKQRMFENYAHLRTILRELGITNPMRVSVSGGEWFESLTTAPELFGESRGGRGDPRFYDWIDSRWPAEAPISDDGNVYVSRAALNPRLGRFACECDLEHLLELAGYRIFHPERHSLTEQVKVFQGARKLIFAEGSALHLYGLVRRPGQKVATILRRMDPPKIMTDQMGDRDPQDVHILNCLDQILWRMEVADNTAIGVLDFDLLREELIARGFLSDQDVWEVPSEARLNASIREGMEQDEKLGSLEERNAFIASGRAR